MMKIRITAIPPGFAPEEIRAQWVGMEIPYVPGKYDLLCGGIWSGDEQAGGYVVSTDEAIRLLLGLGKIGAAEYWKAVLSRSGDVLRFGKEYCEVCER